MSLVKVQANPELWVNPDHIITVHTVTSTFPENSTCYFRTIDGHRYILPEGTPIWKLILALSGGKPVDE